MKLYYLFPFFLLLACDPMDCTLIVENHSKDTLYVEVGIKNDSRICEITRGLSSYIYFREIVQDSSSWLCMPGARNEAWKDYLLSRPDSSVYIYIFNEDTIQKYDFEKSYDEGNYQVVKRNLRQLDSCNWHVKIY